MNSSTDNFVSRHLGPRDNDISTMLSSLGLSSLDELVAGTVPASIRLVKPLDKKILGDGLTEQQALASLKTTMSKNRVFKSYIGTGYSDCYTPPVILRNLFEDPRWYTPYTPYQAEVSQGRLHALLNFQTMVMDLTGMEIANASMLDEATAAAEGFAMCLNIKGHDRVFFVSEDCHPQTIALVQARAEPLGIPIIVGDHRTFDFSQKVAGTLVQYPTTTGAVHDYTDFIQKTHNADALSVVAADILAMTIFADPGQLGSDIVVGNTQRFGVPLGYGGPHAGYLATQDAHKRQIPGRLVGVSKDAEGNPAVRLAMQTREQHIRREKATSNICTAQALLAVAASFYAIYHGPSGLVEIANRVRLRAHQLRQGLRQLGINVSDATIFDTITIETSDADKYIAAAVSQSLNFRQISSTQIGISVDETTSESDIHTILGVFGGIGIELSQVSDPILEGLIRTTPILEHPVFHSHRSETEMLRYMNRLTNMDISLANSMIPLGSCTMKLNATAEMIPITWPEVNGIHPFAPLDQTEGYREMLTELEAMLCEITGFDAISLQPNSGSQGEYTGLLVIRKYHSDRGEGHRNVCLIPQSAHGTNPASAAMVGMKIVVIKTDPSGNIDVADLEARANEFTDNLAALMVTYPSTHGVFEESIKTICSIVHTHGGQVYMDGANMNAQVGLCRPGDFGADVCHLNLHKTFCIPHGGGGPGMGPIGVASHLIPFLPTHPLVKTGGDRGIGLVSEAPYGSASILPISYNYIKMMGAEGIKMATEVALLNANYVAKKLDPYFPVLYKGANGFVAHECILDLRGIKTNSGVEVEDVAKRLMDYGFHAPTVSFPVPGTMMFEPTESESKEELDRFCEAMIAIRSEISEIEEGIVDRRQNVLKGAPHTVEQVSSDTWTKPYSRQKAAFPLEWVRDRKYWPPVARVDNVYGDRNVICSCPPIDSFS